jgi:2-octaprenyl-6-methoxyphenol hydroxylase
MGLRDVAALAEVLTDARRLGLDIGTASVLDDYEQWRRFDNTLMLAMTDGLNRLFSNNITPLKLARNTGLAAVNKAGPLKKVFMRHAMGSTGNLPRLLKGEAL